jgi:hypothetical protein
MRIMHPYTQIPSTLPAEAEITAHLESGKIGYFPHLAFALDPACADPAAMADSLGGLSAKRKSVSYNPKDQRMKGIEETAPQGAPIKKMLQAYAMFAEKLMTVLCPFYTGNLRTGRTSFRPLEVKGRPSSYRKDDSRLHVDAFPSMPMGEDRILRVFSNVHPQQQARIWRVGEPFAEVVSQFFPRLRAPWWKERELLQLLHITKKERTRYDHYMLQLHDHMKYDQHYQRSAKQQTLSFAAGSTWVVYSDLVSHAAMSGSYLLEQTFYLPFRKMQEPNQAPQRVLEAYY